MNRIVLIDRENLTYGLRSLLDNNSKIVARDNRPIFALAKSASSTRIISLPIATKYLNNLNT